MATVVVTPRTNNIDTTNTSTTTSLSSSSTRPAVTLRLPQLQNLCKRDPTGHRSDYDAQIRRLQSESGILRLSPSSTLSPSSNLIELIQFAAAVSSSSYIGEESDRIADLLIELLVGSSSTSSTTTSSTSDDQLLASLSNSTAIQLHRGVRKACISALILMRNKGVIPALRLLELFFRIMSCVPDKNLREMLHRHIVNDVRNLNKKGRRDDKVNRAIQSFLHRVLTARASQAGAEQQKVGGGEEGTSSDVAARRAIEMVCELYRRGVWTDERSVSIVASAVESPIAAVMSRAIRFFLNIEEKMKDDELKQKEEEWNQASEVDLHLHSKKTLHRKRETKRQMKKRAKVQKQREGVDELVNIDPNNDKGVQVSKKLFPAIEKLHDPQGLAETVLRRIKSSGSSKYKFEVKLLMINFVTRLVGNHELLLLPLYPLLVRYMGGYQRDVTAILAYTIQACHEYVPPEDIHAILKTITHNFITERCSGEQMAVGINAVRAICSRVPSVLHTDESETGMSSVMDVEAFVRDLAGFVKHKDRSVCIAGRAWTNFIRETSPSLLQGKHRGLTGSALYKNGEKPLRYGERKVASGVEGADLLVEYEAKKKARRLQRHEEQKEEEEEEDVVDDNVDDDEESCSMDDQDEEEPEEDDDHIMKLEQQTNNKSVSKNNDSDDDDNAPDLIELKDDDDNVTNTTTTIDLSQMTADQRRALQQQVSSTRLFSTSDFIKMRKLVEREQRLRRDPRAAAKLKRSLKNNENLSSVGQLSDDDDDDDDDSSSSDSDDNDDSSIHIAGAVNPHDIMAQSKKKRMSKIERLEKILSGRTAFEHKTHGGGSTNTEKKRKKNFLMTKFSRDMRSKVGSKTTAKGGTAGKGKRKFNDNHSSKKRRRKV